MGLTIVADAKDDLPEGLRDKAKQLEGGKWQVTELPDGFGIEDVRGLRTALATTRGTAKRLADKLGDFGWRIGENGQAWAAEGIDAIEASEAVEKLKSGTLKSSKEIEDYKATLKASFEKRQRELEESEASLRGELDSTIIAQRAHEAIGKARGRAALLLPLIRDAVKIESTEGKRRVVIKGDNGTPRLSSKKGRESEPMDLDELLESWRGSPEFKGAFELSAAGGSGSTTQSGGSGGSGHSDDGDKPKSARELLTRANQKAHAAGAGR